MSHVEPNTCYGAKGDPTPPPVADVWPDEATAAVIISDYGRPAKLLIARIRSLESEVRRLQTEVRAAIEWIEAATYSDGKKSDILIRLRKAVGDA